MKWFVLIGITAAFLWQSWEVIRPEFARRGIPDCVRTIDTLKTIPQSGSCGTGSGVQIYYTLTRPNETVKSLQAELESEGWTCVQEEDGLQYRKQFDGFWPMNGSVRLRERSVKENPAQDNITVSFWR
ncbi:MAG: hypothetical protein KF784_12820 [Fimbriimonadaceae bacterium]|nr:hypothetical protein [Fimbriimonadaceae bacterium]